MRANLFGFVYEGVRWEEEIRAWVLTLYSRHEKHHVSAHARFYAVPKRMRGTSTSHAFNGKVTQDLDLVYSARQSYNKVR